MSLYHANQVSSVKTPPNLIIVLHSAYVDQGISIQYAQEGYNVLVLRSDIGFPNDIASIRHRLADGSPVGVVTYGLTKNISEHLKYLVEQYATKAVVHYTPDYETGEELAWKSATGNLIPTLYHLAFSQESLHASLLPTPHDESAEANPSGPLVSVSVYPKVSVDPPFALSVRPPALIKGVTLNGPPIDPALRSAVGLSYTRSLRHLRTYLGPWFDLEKLWERHTFYEFAERSSSKTMATMVSTPYVNHVPTMIGGMGFEELSRFYKYHFIDGSPPDTDLVTISRTVGADRLVEEMIFCCTHTNEIDWLLPGVQPTGKKIEIPLVGVVAFRGDKLTFEHLYWDQASVLVQVGLLDPNTLPVAGIATAKKVLDPFGQPSNQLLGRWHESEGLDIS
ncbi:NTF2-like protein [Sistotremastrum niveocremeum HHB9708]|uniref:NTF2-like protein n=1 Tax=Sistotremastrum niveocremeum HHB9708 TaxID=1314777 RepID=A0A164XMJ7_9AGAM|nr:NTF2-like protein [Sistotremastrum niveocremeum HHB9708]